MLPFRCSKPGCEHFRDIFHAEPNQNPTLCPKCGSETTRLEIIHLVVPDRNGDIRSPGDRSAYSVVCGTKNPIRYTNLAEAATCKACLEKALKQE